MAGWFGPSEDCGCCRCVCDDDGSATSDRFIANAAKVVISGLPSLFEWLDVSTSPFLEYNIYKLSGLDALNGTYFMPLKLYTSGCIFEQESPLSEFEDLSLAQSGRAHADPLFNPICTWEDEVEGITYIPRVLLTIDYVTSIGPTAILETIIRPDKELDDPGEGPMQLFAKTVLRCSKQYDMYEATDTATPWPGGESYPVSSGEIWITGPNRRSCSAGGNVLNPYYVVGSIESELVTL